MNCVVYMYITVRLSLATIASCLLCQQGNKEELPQKNFRCFDVVFSRIYVIYESYL